MWLETSRLDGAQSAMHVVVVLASLGAALESAVARELGSHGGGCETTDKVTLQLKWLVQAQFMGYLAGREIGGARSGTSARRIASCARCVPVTL